MRRFLKLAAAIPAAALVVLGAGAGPASAHGNAHNIAVSGSMYLVDHETWGPNETGWRQFSGSTVVTPWQTQNQYFTSGCVGGEVRGELRVTVNDSTAYPGWAYVSVDARLYEGTSCTTGDLDGRRTMGAWIARGQLRNFAFKVSNTDEGGDYIDFNFNVANYTT